MALADLVLPVDGCKDRHFTEGVYIIHNFLDSNYVFDRNARWISLFAGIGGPNWNPKLRVIKPSF